MAMASGDLPAAVMSSGLFKVTFLMFVAGILLFGPANFAAFVGNPQLYAVVIAIILGLFIVKRI